MRWTFSELTNAVGLCRPLKRYFIDHAQATARITRILPQQVSRCRQGNGVVPAPAQGRMERHCCLSKLWRADESGGSNEDIWPTRQGDTSRRLVPKPR
jgi:hypothetical protein